MPGIILIVLILGYTGFVIYRKTKDMKAGKSCCSGCSSCQDRDKCESSRYLILFKNKKGNGSNV